MSKRDPFIEFDAPSASGGPAIPDRGARLPGFHGMPANAVQALASLWATLVGAGSVGSRIALHLARLQIAALDIIDSGRLKPESLLTHPIRPEDISQSKATWVGRLCKAISPGTRVRAFDGAVQDLPLPAFGATRLVVLSTDNLHAEVDVAQRCLHLGLPVCQAAVHGSTLVAQCRFYANDNADGPCIVCGFSDAEWAYLNNHTEFSCTGYASGRSRAQVARDPTMSTSALCSIAADLAITQILRDTLGLGQPVRDTVVEHCGFTHKTVVGPLRRNPDCVCDHVAYRRARTLRPLPQLTLHELASLAGVDGATDLSHTSFIVDDLSFAETGACRQGHVQELQRFVAPGRAAGRCKSCGAPLHPLAFYTHRTVPAAVLGERVRRPLRTLGARSARWVVTRGTDIGTLFECGGQ